MSENKDKSGPYIVRWPHDGDPVCPCGGSGPWLEDTRSGECIFNGGEPEDLVLGRDLDVFVQRLNAEVKIANSILAAFDAMEAAIAKARGA